MAKGTNKQSQAASSRQIQQTRLYDDANIETRYEILNKLGEGSFGMVSRVRNKENQLFYAMKTIPKKVISTRNFY
jgi:serine/threonine protein kinase